MRWAMIALFEVVLFLLVVLSLVTPSHVHRGKFDQAFMVWYRNPTPENRAKLNEQGRINLQIDLAFNAVIFGSFALNTWTLYRLTKRMRKGTTPLPDSSTSSE